MAMAAPSSVSSHARPAAVLRPRASAGGGSVPPARAGKWWAPLLGWSGRADYLEARAPVVPVRHDDGAAAAAGRRAAALLTEEKARELRARMVETECFHDAMYHSAIASRLARSS